MKLVHQFIKNIPEHLEEGKLYISMDYSTAIHKCCCGCGNEVVTPLSPDDWKLLYDGVTISLYPSIGNWNFPCNSHYWIAYDEAIMITRTGKELFEHDRLIERWSKNFFNERPRKRRLSQFARRLLHTLFAPKRHSKAQNRASSSTQSDKDWTND